MNEKEEINHNDIEMSQNPQIPASISATGSQIGLKELEFLKKSFGVDNYDNINENKEMNDMMKVNKYWESCNKDIRVILIVGNMSNCLFQIKRIISPTKDSELYMNIGYTINSMLIFVIIGLSFMKRFDVTFCYYGLFPFFLR